MNLLGHASERIESAFEFTFEAAESAGNFLFHFLVLGLSQAGIEWVALHRATATNAGRNDVFASGVELAESFDITPVLGRVLVRFLETIVVIFDDGVEQISKDCVRLGIRGVDSDTRVVVLETCKGYISDD